MSSSYIEALLFEREGYVRRNLPDRVKSVDEALAIARKAAKAVDVAEVPEALPPTVELAVAAKLKGRRS